MIFGSSKKNKVEQHVIEYLTLAEQCINKCNEGFEKYYLRNIADDQFLDESIKQVHEYESKCDDKRNDIEYKMYDRSLIPESRGDILGLLEATDKLPNKAESVLRELYKSNLSLPSEFKERVKELFKINIDASYAAIKIVRKYFEDPKDINLLEKEIDHLESQSDTIQMKLERAVSVSDLKDFDKIVLRTFVHRLGMLSDVAENIGERVKLLSVKTVF